LDQYIGVQGQPNLIVNINNLITKDENVIDSFINGCKCNVMHDLNHGLLNIVTLFFLWKIDLKESKQ
jgi:hypothetical protein